MGRIRRSLLVLENGSEHLKNRVKRGFWPWDAEDSIIEETTPKPVDFFDLFNTNENGEYESPEHFSFGEYTILNI